MKIDITRIEKLVGSQMDAGGALNIVTREYCLPLTQCSVCTEDCGLCRERLEAMFDLSGARVPGALLTYQARLGRALAIEAAHAHEAPDLHVEFTGLADIEDPFVSFLSKL